MDDLISRDELISKIRKYERKMNCNYLAGIERKIAKTLINDYVLPIVREAPKAKAKRVSYGYWLRLKPEDAHLSCSECIARDLDAGHEMRYRNDIFHILRYCPECGARMGGNRYEMEKIMKEETP